MKFLPLVWAALWRKPGEALLICLAMTAAFSLFGLMLGVVGMWGLKGGVVLITLMGIGAVWAVSEIISVHRMGC